MSLENDENSGSLEQAADVVQPPEAHEAKTGEQLKTLAQNVGKDIRLEAAGAEKRVGKVLGDVVSENQVDPDSADRLREKQRGEITQLQQDSLGEIDKLRPPETREETIGKISEIRDRLSTEKDLRSIVTLRAEATRLIRELVPTVTDENATETIRAFNESHGDSLRGFEHTLVQQDRDRLVIVDAAGNVQELPVSKENAKDVLEQIKEADRSLDKKGNSYDLRQEIVTRSQGGIQTTDAYTFEDVPTVWEKKKGYLDDPENWLPERQLLQQEIYDEELQNALDLSARVGEKNLILAMRGNTAAGKTSSLRTHESFQRTIHPDTGEPTGAINPDTYKTRLKAHAQKDSRETISHFQAHFEGASIGRRIAKTIENTEEAAMVIDKRFSYPDDVTELLDTAERTGRSVRFMDVDAPMESSLVRVLNRKVGGRDPTVPFNSIAEGFRGVRANRRALIEQVTAPGSKVDTYVLYAPDATGAQRIVAKKEKGVFTIVDDEAFRAATSTDDVEPTVLQLSETVIDDSYIQKFVSSIPESFRASTQTALEAYKGKTLKAALDDHAAKINP